VDQISCPLRVRQHRRGRGRPDRPAERPGQVIRWDPLAEPGSHHPGYPGGSREVRLDADFLPAELAVSAGTLAELAAGPHATKDGAERARRQDRLQRAEAAFDPLPMDGAVARACGRVDAEVVASGPRTMVGAHSTG
jgi:hypothetical protein